MLKNALICLLWLLPNIAFATSGSCSNTQLADYLMHEDKSIVSFTMVNSQFSREI
ncbi:hypothetical protein [Bathymodiolus japonicus methanotrophic gill symbiont]|uniref:hypothetical protein n=1 Tax=Bathymodiolus japonicus methanotrophic gill symbiont TaxID=113269 RepID=UPI001C8DFBE7|nr:hypothetical protein [Bathymodiolus japonicus methanotrophic gill symbiont]